MHSLCGFHIPSAHFSPRCSGLSIRLPDRPFSNFRGSKADVVSRNSKRSIEPLCDTEIMKCSVGWDASRAGCQCTYSAPRDVSEKREREMLRARKRIARDLPLVKIAGLPHGIASFRLSVRKAKTESRLENALKSRSSLWDARLVRSFVIACLASRRSNKQLAKKRKKKGEEEWPI